MADSAHIRVTNRGSAMTAGGISFPAGATSIRIRTAKALAKLGCIDAEGSKLYFDVTDAVATGSLGMTLSLAADTSSAPFGMSLALSADGTIGG